MSGGRLCVFQMHHTDVVPGLERRNAVEGAAASGLFARVVLAAGDVPENGGLADWARRWGVELFLGAQDDVARRILDCARESGSDVVARALVWWFFLDLDLLAGLLGELESSGADYVNLPLDFDIRFGADVFRRRFLEQVVEGTEVPRFRRNPWGFAEEHPERFELATREDVPTYGRRAFERVRRGMRALWPERWDGAGTPLTPYRIASGRMEEGERVLDLACGLGAGTGLLAERGRVVGADRSEEAIAVARARHGDRARFIAADAFELDFAEGTFDRIVSVHTMEHLDDDRGFLERVHRWLAPGGELVLEVPLLAERPFAGIDEPLSPGHVREYRIDPLVELLSERFDVRERLGVNRGAYLPIERARSAAMLIAVAR